MRVCWSTRKGQRAVQWLLMTASISSGVVLCIPPIPRQRVLIISPPFDSFLYSIVQSPCQRVVFSLCIALTIRSRPVRMIERGIARFRRI